MMAAKQPTKIIQAGGTAFTVIREPRGGKELFHGVGAAIAEAQVVLGGATLVAVALDSHFEARIALQEVRAFRERGASIGTKVGLVVVEIGIAHFSQEEFVVRGPRWRRRRRRRSIHGDGCGGAGGAAGTRGSNCVSR